MKHWDVVAGCLLAFSTGSALAHVPYIERADYSDARPFVVTDVAQSKASYAWLMSPDDIDYFKFDVTTPVDLFLEVIVPACQAYAVFLPWYAVIGPGLPPPGQPIPVPLPSGFGAIVVPNLAHGEVRPTFFEPFGGKSYFSGVQLRQTLTTPGPWTVIAWDPDGRGGDYVMAIGEEERFTPKDVRRSLVNLPIIRQDKELHTTCARP